MRRIVYRLLDGLPPLMAAALFIRLQAPHFGIFKEFLLIVVTYILVMNRLTSGADLTDSWRGKPYSDQFAKLALAVLATDAFVMVLWTVLQLSEELSHQLLLGWLLTSNLLAFVAYGSLHLGARLARQRGEFQRSVMIYGAGELGRSIANQLQESPESGFRLIGFLDDRPAQFDADHQADPIRRDAPIGNLESLQALPTTPDEIWIALPVRAADRIKQIQQACLRLNLQCRYFPDIPTLGLTGYRLDEFMGFPTLRIPNQFRLASMRRIKRFEDIALSTLLLAALAIPMILIALLIKAESEGPVIFRQRRNGFDGKPFTIYKFRTMHIHQEPQGVLTQARQQDPRVTRVGAFLRKFSLDELPQVINVLQGKMSLVGPRPHAVEHSNYYKNHVENYLARYLVKPGITGWAQVNDLRGEIRSLDDMYRRVRHDIFYIENWSIRFDIRILLATGFKMFFSKNAW